MQCIVHWTHLYRPPLGYYCCCSPWGITYAYQLNIRSDEKVPKNEKTCSIVIIYCFLKPLIICDLLNLLFWLKATLFLNRPYTRAKQNDTSAVVKQQTCLTLYFKPIYFQPVDVSREVTELSFHDEAAVFCQICRQQTDQNLWIMMIRINDMEELDL